MEEMIKELVSSGIETDERIVNGILNRRNESLPYLARLATSSENWLDFTPPADPVCVIHLLAKMEDYTARLAINAALLEYYDYTEDWLTEAAPYVLAYIGASAIWTLIALMGYKDTDMFVRNTAAHALVIIANHHPQTKPEIVSAIKDLAQNENDIDVRTLLVDNLLDLRDPHLYKYLENSLKSGFITRDFFTLQHLRDVYTGKIPVTRLHIIDPLRIFSYKGGLQC